MQGAGLGIFSLASASADAYGSSSSGSGSKFGGMIRAGLEARHLRFGLEYNIVPSLNISGFDQNGNATTIKSKNGYIGIKFGICIGGGDK